jgi:hypothetical protein
MLDDRKHRSRRGDSQLFLPAHGSNLEQQVFIDVQIINPLAPSHISSFVSAAASIAHAEKVKSDRYAVAARELNAESIPFA